MAAGTGWRDRKFAMYFPADPPSLHSFPPCLLYQQQGGLVIVPVKKYRLLIIRFFTSIFGRSIGTLTVRRYRCGPLYIYIYIHIHIYLSLNIFLTKQRMKNIWTWTDSLISMQKFKCQSTILGAPWTYVSSIYKKVSCDVMAGDSGIQLVLIWEQASLAFICGCHAVTFNLEIGKTVAAIWKTIATRETLSASACGFLLLLLLWSFMNIYFSINLYTGIARSAIRCGYYSVYHVNVCEWKRTKVIFWCRPCSRSRWRSPLSHNQPFQIWRWRRSTRCRRSLSPMMNNENSWTRCHQTRRQISCHSSPLWHCPEKVDAETDSEGWRKLTRLSIDLRILLVFHVSQLCLSYLLYCDWCRIGGIGRH